MHRINNNRIHRINNIMKRMYCDESAAVLTHARARPRARSGYDMIWYCDTYHRYPDKFPRRFASPRFRLYLRF